ncbi:MAG: DUF4405 domain-containing protein [Candidatus Hydrogenedentales bacterium]|jgi:hypothetical protein
MFGRSFHLKGFASMALALSSLVMVVSGVVLYISPRGRVANWTGWNVLGIEKESWGALHSVMAVLLLVAAGLHLFLNWRTFFSYFYTAALKGFNLKGEFALATVLTVLVVGGTLYRIPPFSAVPVLGERIKDAWEKEDTQLPYAHAELSSIEQYAKQTGTTAEQVTEKLAAKGIKVTGPSQTVGEVAAAHGVTPQALFAETHAGGSSRPSGSGAGLGRKTVRQMCEDEGLALDSVLQKLSAAGIKAGADENVRTVAEQAGKNPHDLLTMLKQPAP